MFQSLEFWLAILIVIGTIGEFFQQRAYRRRLAEKDRRIEELEHLLVEYRNKQPGVVDVDDVNELIPGLGDEAEAPPRGDTIERRHLQTSLRDFFRAIARSRRIVIAPR